LWTSAIIKILYRVKYHKSMIFFLKSLASFWLNPSRRILLNGWQYQMVRDKVHLKFLRYWTGYYGLTRNWWHPIRVKISVIHKALWARGRNWDIFLQNRVIWYRRRHAWGLLREQPCKEAEKISDPVNFLHGSSIERLH
jgi:hypothetical protein